MTGQPGANAHPQETSVRLRKGVPSGGHNLMAGHMAGWLDPHCAVVQSTTYTTVHVEPGVTETSSADSRHP